MSSLPSKTPTNTNPGTTPPVKKKKKSKKRCKFEGCRKKLSISDWECKCGKKFCSVHKPLNMHACTFNWRTQQHDILNATLGKGKSIDTKNFVAIS